MTLKGSIKWLGSGVAFECSTPEGSKFTLAGPAAMNDGKVLGPKPIEILLHAIAACTSIDTIAMLQSKGAQISNYDVSVSAKRGACAPKPIEELHLVYNIQGTRMNSDMVDEILKAAFNVESGVAGTYKSNITWEFNLSE